MSTRFTNMRGLNGPPAEALNMTEAEVTDADTGKVPARIPAAMIPMRK